MGVFGLGCKSSLSKYEPSYQYNTGNPDPENFKILEALEIGNLMVIKVQYPDAKNFEGIKIMVYENVKPIDFMNTRELDPHFFNDTGIKSPIARFKPNKEGWEMAKAFANAWNSRNKGIRSKGTNSTGVK
jgi:hypothetical protein